MSAALVTRGAAAGTIVGFVTLTNSADVACTLYGYVGLGLQDAQHHVLPSTVTRGGGMGTEKKASPVRVVLQPGEVAHAEYSFSDVPSDSSGCAQASYLEVTPPDETDFLLVPASIAPCRGEIGIGPVLSGGAPAQG